MRRLSAASVGVALSTHSTVISPSIMVFAATTATTRVRWGVTTMSMAAQPTGTTPPPPNLDHDTVVSQRNDDAANNFLYMNEATLAQLRQAIQYVTPQRFPLHASYGGMHYHIRQLVQTFRDDHHHPSSSSSSNSTQAANSSGNHPTAAAAATTSSASSSMRGAMCLTTRFKYELQYPSPGGPVLRTQVQPHVWRAATVGGGGESSASRMMAVMLRSTTTGAHFAVFANGSVVAFGSGHAMDDVFGELEHGRGIGGAGGPPTATASGATMPVGAAAPRVIAAEEEDDDLDEFEAPVGMPPDEETIQQADAFLLLRRRMVLDAEVAQLRQLLQPYEQPQDPLLTLPHGLCPVAQLTFTTFDETERGGESLQHYSAVPTSSFIMRHPLESTTTTPFDNPAAGASSSGTTMPSYAEHSEHHNIVLSVPCASEMIPFAFCLAELLHLRALNQLLIPLSNLAGAWKHLILQDGKLPMTLQEARKTKAQVLRISSRHSKIGLTRHRVFWESHHSPSRAVFQSACTHFEVFSMHDQLKERLDSSARTLAYICDEAHFDTNHRLEWVIIALISFELLNAARHAHDRHAVQQTTAAQLSK